MTLSLNSQIYIIMSSMNDVVDGNIAIHSEEIRYFSVTPKYDLQDTVMNSIRNSVIDD